MRLFLALLGLVLPCLVLADPAPPAPSPSVNPLLATGKRLFDSVILNRNPPQDWEKIYAEDAEAGVTRLNSSNFDELIAHGNASDVWVILIQGPSYHGATQPYTYSHGNTTIMIRDDPDGGMDHFKFARLDYQTEATICTKWLVFKPPYIVIAADNGRTLRFFSSSAITASPTHLFGGLKTGMYLNVPPWESSFAPWGSRGWWIDTYLDSWNYFAEKTANIPGIFWVVATGALGQMITGYLYKRDAPAAARPAGTGSKLSEIDTRSLILRERDRMIRESRAAQAAAGGPAGGLAGGLAGGAAGGPAGGPSGAPLGGENAAAAAAGQSSATPATPGKDGARRRKGK